MTHRSEIGSIYTAGLLQGIALVTFPAASGVFMNPSGYGLSHSEYGSMFVPQAIMAVASSLLGIGLRKHLGTKRIYLLGLFSNLLAMTLLVVSRFVEHDHFLAYTILLVATGCMGIGFGFAVPALNTFAAAYFPQKADLAVLVLNGLLGLGTALAPVFVTLFVGAGIWWGLPVLASMIILGLLIFSAFLPLNVGGISPAENERRGKSKIPLRFWAFASFALLYGVCETMNGNWASLYMANRFNAKTALAALALTVFWIAVTTGRALFAAIEKWFSAKLVCRILPFLVAIAFVVIAVVPKAHGSLGILGFGLAGLGCSALLPLTISFGQKELKSISTSVAGGLIAAYQVGYGVAAFAVAPLQIWLGLKLNVIYGATAAVALAMAALSFVITRRLSS